MPKFKVSYLEVRDNIAIVYAQSAEDAAALVGRSLEDDNYENVTGIKIRDIRDVEEVVEEC